MRIVQIVMPGASEYERKCQRVDAEALAAKHEVFLASIDEARAAKADVAHVYASDELPATDFAGFPTPYLSSVSIRKSRWPWRRAAEPAHVVTPLGELPEAVEERYWGSSPREVSRNVVGSFARQSTRNMIEQTLTRIHRFRDDVSWKVFDRVPEPQDLMSVDIWVDPAIDDRDFDGFVAEAVVSGLPIVAARTPINEIRLEKGRTGALVPARDPNEMTHAILTALFKPEVARSRQNAARQTASKFRARQRLRVLSHLYETLIQ
jgi:glycosyltransferase involved in cell wall biosynthesis